MFHPFPTVKPSKNISIIPFPLTQLLNLEFNMWQSHIEPIITKLLDCGHTTTFALNNNSKYCNIAYWWMAINCCPTIIIIFISWFEIEWNRNNITGNWLSTVYYSEPYIGLEYYWSTSHSSSYLWQVRFDIILFVLVIVIQHIYSWNLENDCVYNRQKIFSNTGNPKS